MLEEMKYKGVELDRTEMLATSVLAVVKKRKYFYRPELTLETLIKDIRDKNREKTWVDGDYENDGYWLKGEVKNEELEKALKTIEAAREKDKKLLEEYYDRKNGDLVRILETVETLVYPYSNLKQDEYGKIGGSY